LEASVLTEQIAAQTNINSLKKSLAAEMKELLSQVNSRENTVKELLHKVETLNEIISAEYNKLEKEMNEVNEQEKFKRGSTNRSVDDIKVQIAQEKKKAVDLAMSRMKLEKEAAISALMAKFEHEKEVALELERKKLSEEKKNSVEQTRQELILEKETNVQYLQDELANIKLQMEKERSSRDRTSSVSNEELKAMKIKYEKTIADLKTDHARISGGNIDQMRENIRVLELKLTQVKAENEYLRAFEERLMGEASTLPPPVTHYIESKENNKSLENSEKIPENEGNIFISLLISAVATSEGELVQFEIQASESVKAAHIAPTEEIVQESTEVDEEEITRQLQPSESKIVEYEVAPKVLTPEEAIRLLEMDTRIEQIKRILQKENVDSISTLLEAQRQQNRAVKELIELNEERKKEVEAARETLERRVAILLIENERIRKGLSVDDSITDKALTAEKIEANTKAMLLETAVREKVELEQKVCYYEEQLESTKKLLEAVESSRYELQHMVKALQNKLSSLDSKPSQNNAEDYLRKLQESMDQERVLLVSQIKAVEAKLQYEMQTSKNSIEMVKAANEEILKKIVGEQKSVVNSLTENYESRIRGLTEALTACLNDSALVEELKKETDENIRTSRLLNELEIARVRENMKKLEQDHKNSLDFILNVDKAELQRMHKTIERLKQEFAVLLEEEKVSILETEYNRSNLEILDRIRHELEDYMQDSVNDKHDIKFVIDRDIKTVSALYDAMLSVLKNRRHASTATIKDKNLLVDALQEQMLAKTNALLETKDRLVDQEKVLQKVQTEKSNTQAQDARPVLELQASLKLSEDTITAYKIAHKENERSIVDLMHRINNNQILLEEDKRRMKEQDKTVSELRAQIENFKKQLIAHELALAALKLQAETKIHQIATASNITITGNNRPPTDRVAPTAIATNSQLSPAPHRVLQNSASNVSTPHNTVPNRPNTLPTRPLLPPFQPDFALSNLLKSIPLRIDSISANKSTKTVERIWTDMIRNNVIDEEERQRRQFAAELLRRDKRLRQQRVSIAFAKLHERHKHKLMKQQLAEMEPNDHLSQVLKRMDERHKSSMARWEEKKRLLVEQRSKEWELLVRAVTEVANYRTYTSIPLTANPLPIGANTSITVASYPDYPGVVNSGSNKRQIEYTVEVRKPDDRHMLNFKQVYPFGSDGNGPPSKPNFRSLSARRHHLRPFFEGMAPKFDMILEWPGIEGKKIPASYRVEQKRPASAPDLKTPRKETADSFIVEQQQTEEQTAAPLSPVRLPPLSHPQTPKSPSPNSPHTPKMQSVSQGSLSGVQLPPITVVQ
jgi:hypothetical protein